MCACVVTPSVYEPWELTLSAGWRERRSDPWTGTAMVNMPLTDKLLHVIPSKTWTGTAMVDASLKDEL